MTKSRRQGSNKKTCPERKLLTKKGLYFNAESQQKKENIVYGQRTTLARSRCSTCICIIPCVFEESSVLR